MDNVICLRTGAGTRVRAAYGASVEMVNTRNKSPKTSIEMFNSSPIHIFAGEAEWKIKRIENILIVSNEIPTTLSRLLSLSNVDKSGW